MGVANFSALNVEPAPYQARSRCHLFACVFVRAYQARRGVSLIVAATLVAEVGDLSRFHNPKELMAYLGLVPFPSTPAAPRLAPSSTRRNPS
jgi:hypothetical protein